MKFNWTIIILTLLLNPITSRAQEKIKKDNDCWCELVESDPDKGYVAVWNIDLLSAHPGTPKYNNVKGCEGDDCDKKKCTFDEYRCYLLWIQMEDLTEEELANLSDADLEKDSVKVKRCKYEPGGEGDCTDAEFGVDVPWSTNGAPPNPTCDCIFIDDRGGPYVFFINVNIMIASENEDYVFDGDEPCLFDCEESSCYFQKYNHDIGAYEETEGFCTAYWPEGGALAPALKTEEANKTNIKFYPNPANDIIQIEANENATTEIYSLTGQLIMTTSESSIDVSSLASGVYYIVIEQDGEILKDKLIVN